MHTCMQEHAVGGFPLGSGLVVEDRPSELSCSCPLPVHNICCHLYIIILTASCKEIESVDKLTKSHETTDTISRAINSDSALHSIFSSLLYIAYFGRACMLIQAITLKCMKKLTFLGKLLY